MRTLGGACMLEIYHMQGYSTVIHFGLIQQITHIVNSTYTVQCRYSLTDH